MVNEFFVSLMKLEIFIEPAIPLPIYFLRNMYMGIFFIFISPF